MIEIVKTAFTFIVLMVTGLAAVIPSHDDGGDLPSQLRPIDLQNLEPSMQSMLATAGFPAIAESGTQIAIIRNLDEGKNSSVLDVVGVDEKLLKRFSLYLQYGRGNPSSEVAGQHLAAEIVKSNTYLAAGNFKPMEVLFDHTTLGTPVRTSDWEIEAHGQRIRYRNPGPFSVLEISSLADTTRAVRLEWPLIPMELRGQGSIIQCGNKGIPIRAWTDTTGELIVLHILHTGSPVDGCDLPEEWRVLRLPK